MSRIVNSNISRAFAPLFVLITLSGCGNIQNIQSTFTPGSSVDDIEGRFVDTASKAKIDYASQIRARKAIADKADPKATFPGEAHIGLIDHSRFLPTQTVIYDPQVEQFFKGILAKLLENWHGQTPDIRIAFVVDSPDAPYEAESGADGTIYFGMSAIRDVESTDELVFKIAHELGHILMNHTVRVEQENTNRSMRGLGAMGALMGNSAAATTATAQSASSRNTTIALALAGSEILFSDILTPAFSRQQEREADLLGADLMIKAGYSPRAINQVMQRLRDQEVKKQEAEKKLRDAELALQKQKEADEAAARGQKRVVSGAEISSSIGGELSSLFDQIKASHPEANDRRNDLERYIRREYTTEQRTRRVLRQEEYERFKVAIANGPLMRRQFTVMAAGFIKDGDLTKAYTFAQRALANANDPAPEARLQLYQIRKAQAGTGPASASTKMRGEAVRHLELAWKGPEATPAVATFLAEEYSAGKRYDAAEAVLVEAGRRHGPTPFYSARIRNFIAGGRQDQAFTTTYQCEASSPPAEVRAECRASLPSAWTERYAAFVTQKKAEEERQREQAKARASES